MTTLNELPTKKSILNTDNLLLSDEQSNDAKVSADQLKEFIAPAATEKRAGVVTTKAQSFSGDKDFKGDVNFSGAITQNGQPLITDVEISAEEGNALEKKEDGLYVDASSSWTGTQEEFDALDKSTLKDGQQINILDDTAEKENVYKTSETICGYWIDGKPIYRRVINFSSPILIGINAETLLSGVLNGNEKRIIDCIEIGYRQTNDRPMTLHPITFKNTDDRIVFSQTHGCYTEELILEYTKTTD